MGKHAMNFLATKSWHVGTIANQKKLWEAKQRQADVEKKQDERARERAAEEARWHQKEEAALIAGEELGEKAKLERGLEFMYQPPPGTLVASEVAQQERQPSSSAADTSAGSRELSEKERFPFLKNAPTQGSYTDDMRVTHKPLGREVRNVQCSRCGEWGHQSGERECSMKDLNPHGKLRCLWLANDSCSDAERIIREDPLTAMRSAAGDMPLVGTGLLLKGSATDRAVSVPEEESDLSDVDRKFLASLRPGQKRRLLKRLRQDAAPSAAIANHEKHHRHKHSHKHDHHKHKH